MLSSSFPSHNTPFTYLSPTFCQLLNNHIKFGCDIQSTISDSHFSFTFAEKNQFPFSLLFFFHEKSDNHKAIHEETSTISTQQPIPGSDISYSIRHVEESWHHLIKSDDSKKLKEIAVCNFDFLLAAVSIFFLT